MSITFEELTEGYGYAGDEIQIPIHNGLVLTARAAKDASELIALEKRAAQMTKILQERPAPHLLPYLPAAEEVVRLAVICEALMLDPKMTLQDGLRLGKEFGFLLVEIGASLAPQARAIASENEMEAIEAEKNA